MDAAEWAERQAALAATVEASHGIGPAASELTDGDLEVAIRGAELLMEATRQAEEPAVYWWWYRILQLLTTERGRRRAIAGGVAAGEVAQLEALLLL